MADDLSFEDNQPANGNYARLLAPMDVGENESGCGNIALPEKRGGRGGWDSEEGGLKSAGRPRAWEDPQILAKRKGILYNTKTRHWLSY
jgi:hypothetical protein